MPGMKISSMPVVENLTGNEVIPIVVDGENKSTTTGKLFGEDGKSFLWQGAWNNSKVYSVQDVVSFLGVSWTCKIAGSGNQPGMSSTTWDKMVEKGDQGPQGNQGLKGDNGLQGPPGPTIDQYLLDIWDWNGSSVVALDQFLNFASLSLVKRSGGTLGSTIVSNAIKMPVKSKPSQVVFTIRMTGIIAGAVPQAREWRIQTRRATGEIVGSVADLKITGNEILNRDIDMTSYTLDANDPFGLAGIQLGLLNNSGQVMTVTAVSIRIGRVVNPDV